MSINKKFLLFIGIITSAIFGIFMNTTSVNAESYSGQAIWPSEFIQNIYIKKDRPDGYSKYQQARFLRRSEDNKFVYCLQPFVEIDNNYVYTVVRGDYEAYLNMTKEQFKKVNLYAYYGYGYGNHTDHKWYAITQVLIWRTVEPNSQIYFTNTLNGTRNDNLYTSEIAELERLVNSHYTIPSLNESNNMTLSLNESITINDNNSKLNEYKVKETNNVNASINGNSLTITATGIGNGKITLTKSDTKYEVPPIVYVNDHSQNVFRLGSYDPVTVNLNLKIVGGKVELKKVDSMTNSIQTQGEGVLSNAKYGVYNTNGTLIETLITDNKGYAISNYLPSVGTFYIQEISASKGYKIDSQKYYFEINSNNLLASVVSKEEIIKGKIKVNKYDSETKTCKAQGDASLVGAKYGIYNSKNELVDTLTILNDCSATSKELPYGNYVVKELTASEGYYIDLNLHNVNITAENIYNVTSYENVIKTRLKVNKYDSETKTCKAQGDASLVGAKYGIYNSKNELVDTLTISNDCSATSKELPYGKYNIKELEPSEGYRIDSSVYKVNVVNNSLITVVSYENVIKNYISILKQYEYIDGQTAFLNAEKNITFEIYNNKNELYKSIVTDKNGYASIDLPYGVWKLHQVNTTTGYEKIYDFYVTVNKESNEEQYYNILNNALSAYLQVFKVDSETGKKIALENTTFKILNIDTNQYVSQYVGGKVYSEFKTDSEGKMITYLKLKSGNYKLIEVTSPKGYVINTEGTKFTIGNDTHFNYTTYGAFITLEYKNQPIKGQIEIYKKGEEFIIENNTYKYGSKELSNVKFNIYAKEDIFSSDKNHLYYKKDALVDVVVTDKNGYAISKLLPLGKYYIKEVETNSEYVLDKKEYSIELNEIDNKTSIVYESSNVLNGLKKGTITFTKTDLTTGNVIPNTKMEIYTNQDKLIFKGTTDSEGKIIINNLPIGKYYIIEKEASTGYRLSNEKVFFEILEDGEIVKATMTNEKKKGTLEFTKLDISTSEPLPNTLIEIYNENNELIFSERTNDEGKVIIEELEYGKYYIIEKEAPDGYYLNKEKMYFEILEDGEIVKATMTDEKIIIEVPNTEENNFIIPISLILIGIASGVIIYEEIKKRKTK